MLTQESALKMIFLITNPISILTHACDRTCPERSERVKNTPKTPPFQGLGGRLLTTVYYFFFPSREVTWP